jgi:lipopolysaccharide transport system ATP-binding protein
MKPIIRVENLGKQYRIGRREAAYATLRESLVGAARAPFDRLRRGFRREVNGDAASDRFWALRDVSFEVTPGQVVGIIGRNGAGKTTLLKILSRVTEPTEGRADLYGRVGSLLEVGTGFHPELTGRENVYLNGAILGMKRSDIARKFDEIVAFAEVEKFIDTPVKRYSSGMYVRLAFAVAAHLEPEILIIDEVLAVGDAVFQKKCLGKIGDVAHGGRTVLFVSHNMAAVSALCERVLLMRQGRLTFDGPSSAAIARYLQAGAATPSVDLSSATNRQGAHEYGRLSSLSLFDAAGSPCDSFAMGEAMIVELQVECSRRLYPAEVGFGLASSLGATIHLFVSAWEGLELDLEPGRHRFRVTVPQVLVFPGTYILTPYFNRQGRPIDDQVDAAMQITVVGADVTGHNPYFERHSFSKGEVYCPSLWTHMSEIDENQMQASRGTHD